MTTSVNAAGRLDRLPMGSFQWRILSLIGLGMFFDGFDNQMAAGVLGALVKEGWSTMEMNAHYISITFAGLAVGALMTGLVGDRFGRFRSHLAPTARTEGTGNARPEQF